MAQVGSCLAFISLKNSKKRAAPASVPCAKASTIDCTWALVSHRIDGFERAPIQPCGGGCASADTARSSDTAMARGTFMSCLFVQGPMSDNGDANRELRHGAVKTPSSLRL